MKPLRKKKKQEVKELESGPKIDLQNIIKFTKKNWYWINPALKSAYKFINNSIKKWKEKRAEKLNNKHINQN